jgi:hypothetical protein
MQFSLALAQLAQTGKPWHFCLRFLHRSQDFLARLEGRGFSPIINGVPSSSGGTIKVPRVCRQRHRGDPPHTGAHDISDDLTPVKSGRLEGKLGVGA